MRVLVFAYTCEPGLEVSHLTYYENVATVRTEAMPGAFDFLPALREAAADCGSIERSTPSSAQKTCPSSHRLASINTASFPHGISNSPAHRV
jgi:hypothetical protein